MTVKVVSHKGAAPAKAAEETRQKTPAEKALLRTAGCIVCKCELFAFNRVMDGFRQCECNHTQHAHKAP